MTDSTRKSDPVFSRAEKRILIIVVFFVIITRLLPALRSEGQLYSAPYTEDGFYLFSCAEHIAHGDGFTCDGKHLTNGVQPLIVFLYVPFFLLAGLNKLLALKLSFILVALFDAISTMLIASLVKILSKEREKAPTAWYSPPVVAAILWAGLYTVFIHTANGLETGLYSMLLLAVLCYYAKLTTGRVQGREIQWRQWLALGLLLGITVLARIDAVFLVIAIASYEIFTFRKKGVLPFFIVSLSAFIISGPWWWYNFTYFGSIMPQSGISESIGVALRLNFQDFSRYMGELLSLFFYFSESVLPGWFSITWFLTILACIYFLFRRYRPDKFVKNSYYYGVLSPYFFFCISLAVIYALFFNSSYFYPRYFQPIRILWLIAIAAISPEIFLRLRNIYSQRKIVLIAVVTLFLVAAAGFSIRKYYNLFAITEPNSFYLTGLWALEHPGERIGMLQSGTVGFIAPNAVNLDGKVNFAALQALRKRDLGLYIESEKLDYLADWREYAEVMARAAARHGGKFVETDSIGNIIIFKRVGK